MPNKKPLIDLSKKRHFKFLQVMELNKRGILDNTEAERIASKNQFAAIMGEFNEKKLYSGTGALVTSPEQAKRIALEELRRWTEIYNKNPSKDLKKIDPDKFSLVSEVLDKAPEELKQLFLACEFIGLNERITYHKVQNGENVPYTHIFDNETVALKHKDYPMIIIYGPHIKYKNNFIEG